MRNESQLALLTVPFKDCTNVRQSLTVHVYCLILKQPIFQEQKREMYKTPIPHFLMS